MTKTLLHLQARAEAASAPLEKIDALNAYAWELLSHNRTQARAVATEAAALAQAQHYQRGIMGSRVVIAETTFMTGQVEEAVQAAQAVYDFHEKLGRPDVQQIQALFIIGFAVLERGQSRVKALDIHLRMVELAQALGEDTWLAIAYRFIGNRYNDHGGYADALKWYQKAADICLRIDDQSGLAMIYNNICSTYNRSGNFAEALVYGQKALALYPPDHSHGQSIVRGNLGVTLTGLSRYEEALNYLRQAVEFAERHDHTFIRTVALIYLGRYHVQMGQDAAATPHLEEALRLTEATGATRQRCEALHELVTVYERSGQLAKALASEQEAHQLEASQLRAECYQGLQHFETLYATQKAVIEAETEKRLREQEAQHFARLAHLKDEFLVRATHDLKNPLARIQLSTGVLRNAAPDQATMRERAVQRIESAVIHMRDLVTDVLDFARLESGRGLNLTAVDLVALVRRQTENFAEQALARQIRLHFDPPPAPEIWSKIDERRLLQVLENLIGNALKYTLAGGSVTVRLRVVENEGWVEVADTGVGIPAEAIPQLFEPFYRVEDARVEGIEGTGLGLAIVKTIVEQHKGRVWVESEVGKGSTFYFSLPLT
jgi:signal transduction histidine kinase